MTNREQAINVIRELVPVGAAFLRHMSTEEAGVFNDRLNATFAIVPTAEGMGKVCEQIGLATLILGEKGMSVTAEEFAEQGGRHLASLRNDSDVDVARLALECVGVRLFHGFSAEWFVKQMEKSREPNARKMSGVPASS